MPKKICKTIKENREKIKSFLDRQPSSLVLKVGKQNIKGTLTEKFKAYLFEDCLCKAHYQIPLKNIFIEEDRIMGKFIEQGNKRGYGIIQKLNIESGMN